jgi:hypothetical protein
MPSLTKRKGSDRWYVRRAIPADIKRILAELPREKHPRNWYKDQIWVSTGTADRGRAKAKAPEIAAAIERQITALREGPKPLTVKQIAALSGEAYAAFAQGVEDDPVLSSAQWQDIAKGVSEARNGSALAISEDRGRAHTMERRFGRTADALLAKRQIVADEASRRKLIERLSVDLPNAFKKLARNADADYSPDQYAARFPAWESDEAKVSPGKSLRELAAAWHKAALARGVKERDADRFRGTVLRFVNWLGHDDATRLTRSDVARWADARSAGGIAASTINKVDTAALRAVFEWGTDRGWFTINPLARNVRLESRGKPKVREKFFTESEAAAILNTALAVQPTKREDSRTTSAKRWVPLPGDFKSS